MAEKRASSRKSKKRPWLPLVLITLLVLGGISTIFARPLYRKFKAWRAVGLVEKADKRIEAGQIVKAYEFGAEAFDLSPEHPRVMRLMGEILMSTSTEKERAIYFFEQLEESGEASVEDGVNLAKCYFATAQPSRARELINRLKTEAPDDTVVLGMLAEMERSSGNNRAAADLMKRASSGNESPSESLDLAMARFRMGEAPERFAARDKIIELSQENDPTGLRALEVLGALSQRRGVLGREMVEDLVVRLQSHPDAEDRHVLMGESLRMKLEPTQAEEIVKAAIRERLGLPIPELSAFFVWLTQHGETGWVLDLLDADTAKRHPENLGVYMSALGAEGKWDELDIFLRTEELPISEARKKLMQARVYSEKGLDTSLVLQELSGAMRSAGNSKDFNSVADALGFADRLGADELVKAGLTVLESSPLWREKALEGFYRLAKSDQDFDETKKIVGKILRANPSNERFQLMDVYLNLLSGEALEVASSGAEKLQETMPNLPSSQFLAVLSAYRAGDYEYAVEAARTIDPAQLEFGWRAILAAVIDLGGESRRAVEIAEKIPVELLFDEEKRFLNSALGRRAG